MLRLILLTLVSLFAVLALGGTPELAGSATVETPPVASAQPAPVQPNRAAVMAPQPATGASAEELVKAALAAGDAHAAPRFDGPPLKPSPEYAGRIAAAVVMPATPDALYVTGASVNLRRDAATDAEVIADLARGTAVTPVGPTTGPWLEVEDDAGNRGFVSARYLSPTDPG